MSTVGMQDMDSVDNLLFMANTDKITDKFLYKKIEGQYL